MEIVFFLNDLKSGGVQKRTLRLISGLIDFDEKNEFNITLIVNEREGEYFDLIHPEVELIVLEDLREWSNIILRLRKVLTSKTPDVVVTCMGQEFVKVLLARFVSSVTPKIFIIQAVPVRLPGESKIQNIIRSIAISFFYRYAEKVICVSEDVKKSLMTTNNSLDKKLKVIHNPVVKPETKELAEKEVSHPFFEEDAKVLVSVGRLHLQKDYPTLIKAFKIAKAEVEFSLKLIIVGEGEERNAIEKLIKKHNLENDISLVGYKENPFPFMKKADLFVMSSLWEGLPSVLIEAMAVGTPIVSTDCKAGPREILNEGKYGTLVSISDPRALADGIKSELSQNRDLSKLINRSKDFTIKNSVTQYQELFKSFS